MRVLLKLLRDVGTLRDDFEALLACIGDQRIDKVGCDAAPADFPGDQRVLGYPCSVAFDPGQAANGIGPFNMRVILARSSFWAVLFVAGDGQSFDGCIVGHCNSPSCAQRIGG